MRTYALVTVRMGEMPRVAAAARMVDGVTQVVEMIGQYDLMMQIDADDLAEQDLILDQIANFEGVDRALLCPVARSTFPNQPLLVTARTA